MFQPDWLILCIGFLINLLEWNDPKVITQRLCYILYNAKGHIVKDIFTMLIEIQDNFSDNYVAHIPVFSMTLAFFPQMSGFKFSY